MQTAEVVLNVLRERGRKGLPCTQLYRQMFNRDLYLTAYGNVYSNQGAMTPGVSGETRMAGSGGGCPGKGPVNGTSPGSLPPPRKPAAVPRCMGRRAGGSA